MGSGLSSGAGIAHPVELEQHDTLARGRLLLQPAAGSLGPFRLLH